SSSNDIDVSGNHGDYDAWIFKGQFQFHPDFDHDGYGDNNEVLLIGEPPANYIGVAGDCDDANSNINPDAAEVFDGTDNNCNNITDEPPVCSQHTFGG